MAHRRKMDVNLPVIVLKEGKQFVAYTPALDISTCGDTLEQAHKRFDEAVKLFLEECMRMGTLEDVLIECGWTKEHGKEFVPPQVIQNTFQPIHLAVA